MKIIICFLFLISITFQSNGQVNLVPNPSFEDTASCPTQLDQVYKAIGWDSFGNSPDFFHSCFSLYNSALGYQIPYTGEGYCGFYNLVYSSIESREFIGAELTDSLKIGHTYYISFYLSCAHGTSTSTASNKQGVLFSTVAYDSLNLPPINNFAHFTNNSIIIDSSSWAFINGSFVADSNYTFICIGNFYDSSQTDTLQSNNGTINSNRKSYYFIDNICLSEDSAFCNLNIGIDSYETEKNLILFPNPSYGKFFIKNDFPINKPDFKLVDPIGKPIPINYFIENNIIEIRIYNSIPGLYFLNIHGENFSLTKKIIIN